MPARGYSCTAGARVAVPAGSSRRYTSSPSSHAPTCSAVGQHAQPVSTAHSSCDAAARSFSLKQACHVCGRCRAHLSSTVDNALPLLWRRQPARRVVRQVDHQKLDIRCHQHPQVLQAAGKAMHTVCGCEHSSTARVQQLASQQRRAHSKCAAPLCSSMRMLQSLTVAPVARGTSTNVW